MSGRLKALGALDHLAHRCLDWYINRTLPGWGRVQVWQWRICNAYEGRLDAMGLCACGAALTQGDDAC